ncbi:hypothetical protein VCSRO22_1985 [Vibrio cholerae]|nr:hypothetical protein [Vibrio cholerae]GHY25065.1 hypothetical protein VCSRO22_1985 [Vibrio cholerae]
MHGNIQNSTWQTQGLYIMHKPTISSVIALALLGCGGGESGGGSQPAPLKYFTVDFLGTGTIQASDKNCQVFGYSPESSLGIKDTVVAYVTQPINTTSVQYEVFIHNANGGIVKHFTSIDLKVNRLRFTQSTIPEDGYLSFAYFQSSNRITDVTTFAKSVLPDSFAIHAEGNRNSCLTPSGANPQIKTVSGYIQRMSGTDLLSGFNTSHQNLDEITKNYAKDNPDNKAINFPSQQHPLLALNYETKNSRITSLKGFKFTPFSQRGVQGSPIVLDPVDWTNGEWTSPAPENFIIQNALLFVNGKKLLSNANYAYLWQPLSLDNGSFSYAASIGDENYYLYLKGRQVANGQPRYWGVQHVAQGTNNGVLNADNILDKFPEQPEIKIETCSHSENGQCITIDTGDLNAQQGIQRVLVSTKRQSNNDQSIRHVFYTPIKNSIPTLKFNRTNIDDKLNTNATTFVSLLSTNVKAVQEAFLYQHQTLYSANAADLSVDAIPLLKNIAAQQDQQDLLKRQPYTWVWLEQEAE